MKKWVLFPLIALGLAFSATVIWAEVNESSADPREVFGTLNDKTLPLPDLEGIVKDKEAAIRLGKALFWDVSIGSDGQACASCHFQAGVDPRIVNQISPGIFDQRDIDQNGENGDQSFGGLMSLLVSHLDRSPDNTAGLTAGGQTAQPNLKLQPNDFPLHQLEDEGNRNSDIVYTTNDVMSSMGTFEGDFISVIRRGKEDNCHPPLGDVFHTKGIPVRKVEPRHTPTTVNAVFNFRNFWDGRANNVFNGVDVFGRRDILNNPRARIVVSDANGTMRLKSLALENSSLASQAMGPPLSSFEMSCEGREFTDIGRKILRARPLNNQILHKDDSVLGSLARPQNTGLNTTYALMVREAFDDKFTRINRRFLIDDNGKLVIDRKGFTQMELNFSMFWGIAIMLYESTLVNDDNESAFGRFMAGDDSALNAAEKKGMDVFMGKGKCSSCHSGPTLSKAALHLQSEPAEKGLIERMLMADAKVNTQAAFYDNAFYNIGVTPTVQDLGVGDEDPYGIPLSFTRQILDELRGKREAVDRFEMDPCSFDVRLDPDMSPCDPSSQAALIDKDRFRVAVDGAFKVPTLLNIALTPPYFHDGSVSTLQQLVDFYDRGGNRRNDHIHHQDDSDPHDDGSHDGNDNSGTGPLGDQNPIDPDPMGSNLDPDIQKLGLSTEEKANLVAFLRSLTDDRLRCDQAPFDHPSLAVPNGHVAEDKNGDGKADTVFAHIDAVGKDGVDDAFCVPNTGNLFDMQLRLLQTSESNKVEGVRGIRP